jgi:hypothetical protein
MHEDELEEDVDQEREGIDKDTDALQYIRSRQKVHQLQAARNRDKI